MDLCEPDCSSTPYVPEGWGVQRDTFYPFTQGFEKYISGEFSVFLTDSLMAILCRLGMTLVTLGALLLIWVS